MSNPTELPGLDRLKQIADDLAANYQYSAAEALRGVIESMSRAQPEGEAPQADRLVTLLLIADRAGQVHSDVQTHDNSYAEVARGFAAMRSEMDRVSAEQKDCPYFPATPEAAKVKIIRGAPACRYAITSVQRRIGQTGHP